MHKNATVLVQFERDQLRLYLYAKEQKLKKKRGVNLLEKRKKSKYSEEKKCQ